LQKIFDDLKLSKVDIQVRNSYSKKELRPSVLCVKSLNSITLVFREGEASANFWWETKIRREKKDGFFCHDVKCELDSLR